MTASFSGASTAASERHVTTASGRLYVRERGRGPALVVLHGGPDFNHRYLLPELDRLAARFTLVCYDQRGRGRSSAGVDPEDVTIDSEVADLDRLREDLGLERVALLGHSWGSLLAMEYAARHPDRISQLVLMNTAPASHADLLEMRRRRAAEEPAIVARMREVAATPPFAQGDLAADAEYYRAHFSATLRQPALLADLVGRLRADFSAVDVLKARAIEQRLTAQTWLLPTYDLRPRLAGLGARVLLIHGEHDLVPLACADHIADATGGARPMVIADSGHFSFIERPARVCEAISRFLR